ncbi:MAG: DUF4080 domain-containing protein [Bacteroidales bacterium]|jgi:radical SAM superfamily enzyme YgiQ (UPF0313 family)
MRLIWLDINASYSHSSLALPALHAQLTKNQSESIEWHVVSGTINSDSSLLLLEISDFCPDIILSTAWLFNHSFILNILGRYKSLDPKTVVILGGPEFFGKNEDYLTTHKFINAVFRGEGEESFPLLIDSLFQSSSWTTLQGMCWINEYGDYNDNGDAIVSDFSILNPPEMSRFFNWDKHFVQIETSRGCFNNCTFCVSGGCRMVQSISPSNINDRLKYFCLKGVKEIRVLDRTFNANSERAEELLKIFNDFKGKLKFHLEIHPALLSENIRKRLSMTEPGLLHLEAGLQSLDNQVLNACKRAGSSEKSVDGVKFLVSLNKFELHVDLIAGLPFYTYNALIEDVKFLLTLGVDEIQIELLKLLPGTKLIEDADIYGIVYSSTPPYEVLRTKAISVNELYKVSVLSKMIDIWYNNKIWCETLRNLQKDNPLFIEIFLDYILTNKSLNNRLSQENNGILLYEFCEEFNKKAVFEVASAWIVAGFSLKKGPGKLAMPWIKGLSTESNPLYNEMNNPNEFNYYYLHSDAQKLWFALDKKDKKGKPAKIHLSKQSI